MDDIIGIGDGLCERSNSTVEGENVYTVETIMHKNHIFALEFYNIVGVGFFLSFSGVRAIIITSYGLWRHMVLSCQCIA